MSSVLETKDLSKAFGKRLAVDRINMKINQGDIYGLIGENGAGKTTFMRIICGLASPSEGSFTLFDSSDLESQRHKMGCTIENPAIYPMMTAQENMEVYCRLMGIQNTKVIQDLLEFVGLHQITKKRTRDFSLGMKQRLMIAIALLGDPELMILDEPMNGLDPFGIKEVRDLLLKLNHERNMTILVSSHILDELSKIAGRYGIIHQGRLVDQFTKEELEKRCCKNLRFVTSNTAESVHLIKENVSSNIKVQEDGSLMLFDHLDESAKICRLLVQNRIDVSAIIPGKENLEEYFLTMTGGEIA